MGGGRALGDAIEFFVEKKINQSSDSVDIVFFFKQKHRNCIDNRGTSTAVNGDDTRSQQLFASCRICQGAGACPSHRWHIQVKKDSVLDRNYTHILLISKVFPTSIIYGIFLLGVRYTAGASELVLVLGLCGHFVEVLLLSDPR